MIFLSLGAGVQSSVMLMMAIRGEIQRPDHVIFADTQWESKQVYANVRWFEKQCGKAQIPFHDVTGGNIKADMEISRSAASGEHKRQAVTERRAGRWATMPLFVDTGKPIEGRIKRQCTAEYKLAPLRKKQRELLGYEPRQRIPADSCAVMIGISTDEARRATVATDRWVSNIYPLIDPLKMSRADCQHWWQQHNPHIKLVKSSCQGCPNRSDREWLRMQTDDPEAFQEVCLFDDRIRHATGMKGDSYLHRSLKPLRDVDFNQRQLGLDLEDELYCAGGCGL